MNRICIYPQDKTTDFLLPIYQLLQTKGYVGFHGDICALHEELLGALNKSNKVVFLGHGSSGHLYGTPQGAVQTTLFGKKDMDLLHDKSLFLLSCNSVDLCKYYGLTNAICFGNMPTGREDVLAAMQNDESFPNLQDEDIEVYNKALVRAIYKAFDMNNEKSLENLHSYLYLYINREIVECLLSKPCQMYRNVAECLQDLKNECQIL